MNFEVSSTIENHLRNRAVSILLQDARNGGITKWNIMDVANANGIDYAELYDLIKNILLHQGMDKIKDVKVEIKACNEPQ